MTETGNTATERLTRQMAEDEDAGMKHSLLSRADVRAVLAVVEAAQNVLNQVEDKSLLHWIVYNELRESLAALHTQASDD